MVRLKLCAATAVLPCIWPGSARADLVAARPTASGLTTLAGSVDGTRGWTFNVNSTIEVTQLGVFDDFLNGLPATPVGIWNNGRGLFVQAAISVADGF